MKKTYDQRDSSKSIEDKEDHPDEGVISRVQKSEKRVKIKALNKNFDEALYKLECFVQKNNRYEYGIRVSENMYGSLKKENIIRSLGVYTHRGSSMFIFSLTKKYKVVWEIYTRHYNDDYTWNILDLLQVTDYLYFYQILELVDNDFNNAWSNLLVGLVDSDLPNENNLKFIAFTPFSPNEVAKGSLEELNLNTILACFKGIKSWWHNISLIFKSFEFKDIFTLKRLLILINTHNIKLRKCKVHLTSNFKASIERNPDSKIYIDQWEICDENGLETKSLMDDFRKWLIESSFKQDMIFFQNKDSILVKKWNIARSDDIEQSENRRVASTQIIVKQKKSNYSYKLSNPRQLISPYSLASLNNNRKQESELSLDGVICIPNQPKTAYEDVQFINNNMFAVISNLLILDGFTNYNYVLVRENNYILLVENDNTEDMDDLGEFFCGTNKKRNYEKEFLFKISTDIDVPELHINWKISVNLFKLLLNILDKMKVKLYFIVNLKYLLNIENDFEEILKELGYRLNFKIYTESIVYKFINNRKVTITNEKLKLFNEIYTLMISNEWNMFILNLKLLNSCLLDKLIKTNEEISANIFYSEEIPHGKKKIIYYKQWKFIIDNDEELKIIEGRSYSIYFDDWLFGTELALKSNYYRKFRCLRSIPEYLLKYNNIFYGINSRICYEKNDEYYSSENNTSYIDILVWKKVKEKWSFLVKYYSYRVREYKLGNSDIFGYLIKINKLSNIILLNPIKLYEKWGIDSFPDYSNEYLIENISNNNDVKNIWNTIDNIRNNDNEGICYFSIKSVFFINNRNYIVKCWIN